MGKNFLIIVICLFVSVNAFAQPAVDGFMKGKGNMDLVGGITYDNFSQYFAAPGPLPLRRTTTSASFFAAAGITKWLDIQVNVPYVITASDWSNLQDISVFSKGRLLNKSMKNGTFSTMLAAGFSTPMTEYPTQGLNAIGQQATAIDGRIVLQYFKNNGWFTMIQGGYTYRLTPTPVSTPLALKIGKAANSNYFDMYYDFQESSGGTDYADGSNPLFTTLGVSYHKVGATFYKPFGKGKVGVAMGMYTVFAGRNVGQSIGANVAFIYKTKYLKNE